VSVLVSGFWLRIARFSFLHNELTATEAEEWRKLRSHLLFIFNQLLQNYDLVLSTIPLVGNYYRDDILPLSISWALIHLWVIWHFHISPVEEWNYSIPMISRLGISCSL
jgi:hypothetical protein